MKVGYLEYRKTQVITEFTTSEETIELSEIELEENDSSRFDIGENGKILWNLEYHIVYSPTYEVPEIYVRGWSDEGSYLSDSQILQLTSAHLRDDIQKVKYGGGLTCMEHPILRTPFYRLHPCETASVLKEVIGEKELSLTSYIPTYINLIGPSVGLSLSLEYFV
ncbi:E2-like conjugating enzyme atg10, variant 2 [Basidiobolus ranarum]